MNSRAKNILLHLRLPFSALLCPVFLFSLSRAQEIQPGRAAVAFFCFHFLIYPSSNAYNSYYDQDRGSIGGLRNPVPATRDLLVASTGMDLVAITLAWLLGWPFALSALAYILASRSYSHPSVRLKRYPWISWFVITLFQGAVVFIAAQQAASIRPIAFGARPDLILGALLSSALIGAYYPLTQIYQHDEDRDRGDVTLSRILGVRGTFVFSGALLGLANALFYGYFARFESLTHFAWMMALTAPAGVFFVYWGRKAFKNKNAADFDNTMRLNWLGAGTMNLFFLSELLLNQTRL